MAMAELQREIIAEDQSRLLPLIDKLSGLRILVVGDVILDEYLIGNAQRLSREAPIPVLEFSRRELIPGGAANPAANISALGSTAIQVSVIGNDPNAATLRDLLQSRGIDTAGLVVDPDRPTTTKTRMMAHMGLRFPQQIARMDWIDRRPICGDVEQEIIAHIRNLSDNVDAIMVSDYLTGLMTETVVRSVVSAYRDSRIVVTADAQGEIDKYAGFNLVKCNADEAVKYMNRNLNSDEDFEAAGERMSFRLRLRGGMLITRGPDGITLFRSDKHVTHIPAVHVEDVYDTVGAGDTVLAVSTLALAAGASYADAAALANIAAGIVVRKVGNYTPTADELRQAITDCN